MDVRSGHAVDGGAGRMLDAADRAALSELAPVLRKAADLDARAVARIRRRGGTAAVLVRLPFRVLVARTVDDPDQPTRPLDVAVDVAEVLSWLTEPAQASPAPQEQRWRSGVPPERGWQRLDTVPDDAVRPLVRSGALALKEAAQREGVPNAQPRAEVADALLDSVVLTVSGEADARGRVQEAPVTLRALSALTRMGFLPRGGAAHVDVCGRWIRVVGGYGTVYLERPGSGLTLA